MIVGDNFQLEQKAEELDRQSFFSLGYIWNGYYVKADFKKALEYYKKAADNNSSDGNIALADISLWGLGLDINLDLAKKYYKIEHNIGNPEEHLVLLNNNCKSYRWPWYNKCYLSFQNSWIWVYDAWHHL